MYVAFTAALLFCCWCWLPDAPASSLIHAGPGSPSSSRRNRQRQRPHARPRRLLRRRQHPLSRSRVAADRSPATLGGACRVEACPVEASRGDACCLAVACRFEAGRIDASCLEACCLKASCRLPPAAPRCDRRAAATPTWTWRNSRSGSEPPKRSASSPRSSLKNQVDDLLDQFRDYYKGKAKLTMTELRRSYDLLMMKVLIAAAGRRPEARVRHRVLARGDLGPARGPEEIRHPPG